MLESPDSQEDDRRKAAMLLERSKDPAAVPPLIRSLRDDKPDVQRSSARALGHLGSPEALQPLVDLLDDEDEGVRAAALGPWANSAIGARSPSAGGA